MASAIVYLIAAWGCVILCAATVGFARSKAWWWITIAMGWAFVITALIELALETA